MVTKDVTTKEPASQSLTLEEELLKMGEVVLRNQKPKHGFEFLITKQTDPEKWPVTGCTPYRSSIMYAGDTVEEVVGSMLYDMARLARSGSLNPERPEDKGSPPIQHVVQVLSERLLWQVERRKEHLEGAGEGSHLREFESQEERDREKERFEEMALKEVSRDNEIISALATSISALARVKDL
jgi:hypothetical protein